MGLTDLLFPKRLGQIDGLEIDATVHEVHGVKAKATRHPVESGSDVTDHVQLMPDEIQIEGVITDTPLIGIADLLLGQVDLATLTGQRASGAWDLLEQTVKARQPIKVVTTLKTYDNVILEDLSAPRDAENGNAIHFTVRGVVIRIVSSQNVGLPIPKEARGAATQALGKKPPAPSAFGGGVSLTHKLLSSTGILP